MLRLVCFNATNSIIVAGMTFSIMNNWHTKIHTTLSDGCKPGHRFNLVSEKCTICPLNTACIGMTITGDPCPSGSFSVPYLTTKCVTLWWLSIPAGILLLIVLVILVAKIWFNKRSGQPSQVHKWQQIKHSGSSNFYNLHIKYYMMHKQGTIFDKNCVLSVISYRW